MSAALPKAPRAVTSETGTPLFGTYEGSIPKVNLHSLQGEYRLGPLGRLKKHKRWVYSFIATPEVLTLQAVADLGYSSNAFILVADLAQGRVIYDHSMLGSPRPLVHVSDYPAEGVEASYRYPRVKMHTSRAFGAERYHIETTHAGSRPLGAPRLKLSADLLAAGAPPPITVVAPVDGGGVVNVTQKHAALLSFGSLEVNGRTFSLDGGVGGFDYTNGYLARHTAWRWAFACGRLGDGSPFAFNLVEGFNETRDDVNENALWFRGRLSPLGRARFTFDRHDPQKPWHVRTTDGALDATFTPIGLHREERDLKFARSFFIQPVGTFAGTLKLDGRTVAFEQVPGVTEDQDILW